MGANDHFEKKLKKQSWNTGKGKKLKPFKCKPKLRAKALETLDQELDDQILDKPIKLKRRRTLTREQREVNSKIKWDAYMKWLKEMWAANRKH
jgi:hypothetical protein